MKVTERFAGAGKPFIASGYRFGGAPRPNRRTFAMLAIKADNW